MTESTLHVRLRGIALDSGAYQITITCPPCDAGTPDWLLCHHGVFIGFEIKPPGEKPSAIQMRRLEQIARAGGIAAWGSDRELRRALDHARLARRGAAALPAYISPDTTRQETPA